MDLRDEEVAVLQMQQAEYEQVVQDHDAALHMPSWAGYQRWVDDQVQKGIARGFAVEVEEATAIAVSAWLYATKRDLDVAALSAYARHLLARKLGKG